MKLHFAILFSLILGLALSKEDYLSLAEEHEDLEIHCIENFKDYCKGKKPGFHFQDGCRRCVCSKEHAKCKKGPCEFSLKSGTNAVKYCENVLRRNAEEYKKFLTEGPKKKHEKDQDKSKEHKFHDFMFDGKKMRFVDEKGQMKLQPVRQHKQESSKPELGVKGLTNSHPGNVPHGKIDMKQFNNYLDTLGHRDTLRKELIEEMKKPKKEEQSKSKKEEPKKPKEQRKPKEGEKHNEAKGGSHRPKLEDVVMKKIDMKDFDKMFERMAHRKQEREETKKKQEGRWVDMKEQIAKTSHQQVKEMPQHEQPKKTHHEQERKEVQKSHHVDLKKANEEHGNKKHDAKERLGEKSHHEKPQKEANRFAGKWVEMKEDKSSQEKVHHIKINIANHKPEKHIAKNIDLGKLKIHESIKKEAKQHAPMKAEGIKRFKVESHPELKPIDDHFKSEIDKKHMKIQFDKKEIDNDDAVFKKYRIKAEAEEKPGKLGEKKETPAKTKIHRASGKTELGPPGDKVYLANLNTPQFRSIMESVSAKRAYRREYIASLVRENKHLREEVADLRARLNHCEEYRKKLRNHLKHAMGNRFHNAASIPASATITGLLTIMGLFISQLQFWH